MTKPLEAQESWLQARIARDKALLQQIEAKARQLRRKKDTRMKILAGNAVLGLACEDPAFNARLRALLDDRLTRPHDRRLFEERFPPPPA